MNSRFQYERSPSPPPELTREVATRFRTLPLSELILPEHLRLRGRGTWKTYKRAVEAVFKLKGLERHLERPAVSDIVASRWSEEEKLCCAIITLNIHDIERLRLEDWGHAVVYWETLIALHEGPTVAEKWARVICMDILASVVLGSALALLAILLARFVEMFVDSK